MNLQNGQVVPTATTTLDHASSRCDGSNRSKADHIETVKGARDIDLPTPETQGNPSPKRRKTVSSLRPVKHSASATPAPDSEDGSLSVRQVHTETRFPQRKKPAKEGSVLEPTSTDRLISGIWRQLFSPVQFARLSSVCLSIFLSR